MTTIKPVDKPASTNQRLVCVDALRGFDMLWIIGGAEVIKTLEKASGWPILQGAGIHFDHEWGVFRFYDLIMPLFLFIVGVVMPTAFRRRLQKGQTKADIYKHVFWRVIKLYILGLIASGNLLKLDINALHLWTDALHAIAVGYLFSSILILECNKKQQIIIVSALFLVYWLIMALVPVPGHGAGVFQKDVNLALYIDDRVLGKFQEGYGWTYILTNLTFIGNVMLGAFAGDILLSKLSSKKRLSQLSLIGVALIVTGKLWGLVFPIIHHLWTSTMVLFACGISYLLLALFYYIIDIKGYKKWSFPFVVIGMNALAVYVATKIFDFKLIARVIVGGLEKFIGPWYEFVLTTGALIVVWLILYWMYKTKSFVKI